MATASATVCAADRAAALGVRLRAGCDAVEAAGRQQIAKKLRPLPRELWSALVNLQRDLSLHMPTAEAALRLLNGLAVDPLEAHLGLFEALKENVELAIMRLPPARLLVLLQETIVLLRLKDLRGVPLAIAKRLPEIPSPVLKVLGEFNLLEELPLSVRRQAWEASPVAFTLSLSNVGDRAPAICDMIGQSETLFCMFADHCVRERKGTALVNVVCSMDGSMRSMEAVGDLASIIRRCIDQKHADWESIKSIYRLLRGLVVVQINASRPSHAKDKAAAAAAAATFVPQQVLLEAWAVLSAEDKAGVFAEKVTDAVCPGYTAIVSRPMDLTTMRRSINNNRYNMLAEFERDLQLMVDNCRAYHGSESAYTKLGEHLLSCMHLMRPGILAGKVVRPQIKMEAEPKAPKPKTKAPKIESGIAPEITDEARAERPAKRSTPIDASPVLRSCLLELKTADAQQVFHLPVERVVPDYRKYIKRPMDLQTMEKKLRAGKYASLDDMSDDAELMFENCREFNRVGFFVDEANRLEEVWSAIKRRAEASMAKQPATTSATNAPPTIIKALPLVLPPTRPSTPPVAQPPPSEGRSEPAARAKSSTQVVLAQPDLREMWRVLRDLDCAEVFRETVTEADVPGYSAIIPDPTSLAVIDGFISNGALRDRSRLNDEVQRMLANSLKYCAATNTPDYPKYAEALRGCWDKAFKTWTVALEGSPPEVFGKILGEVGVQHLRRALGDLSLEAVLQQSVLFLAAIDKGGLFAKIPSVKDYRKVVAKPISLAEISSTRHKTLASLHEDVCLMCKNCVLFNFFRDAAKMGMDFLFKWVTWFHVLDGAMKADTPPSAQRKRPLASTADAVADDAQEPPPKKAAAETPHSLGSAADAEAAQALEQALRGLHEGRPVLLSRLLSVADIQEQAGKGRTSTPLLLRALAVCHRFLSALDEGRLFAQPIEDPAFVAAVAQPMDLGTMKARLDRFQYSSLEAFDKDVRLLVLGHLRAHAPRLTAEVAAKIAYAWALVSLNVRVVLGDGGEEATLPENNRAPASAPAHEPAAKAAVTSQDSRLVTPPPPAPPSPEPTAPAPVPVPALSPVAPVPATPTTPAPASQQSIVPMEVVEGDDDVPPPPDDEPPSPSPQAAAPVTAPREWPLPTEAMQPLPPLPLGQTLRYCALMLRDPRLQVLLLRAFAERVRRLVVTQARDSSACEVRLPCDDAELCFVFQLCLLACTREVVFPQPRDVVLRCHVPLLLIAQGADAAKDALRAHPLPRGHGYDQAMLLALLRQFTRHTAGLEASLSR